MTVATVPLRSWCFTCQSRCPDCASYSLSPPCPSQSQLYLQQFVETTLIAPSWFCARQVFDDAGPFDEAGPGTPDDLSFFYTHLQRGGWLAKARFGCLGSAGRCIAELIVLAVQCVGRDGDGNSTLVATLHRLVEPTLNGCLPLVWLRCGGNESPTCRLVFIQHPPFAKSPFVPVSVLHLSDASEVPFVRPSFHIYPPETGTPPAAHIPLPRRLCDGQQGSGLGGHLGREGGTPASPLLGQVCGSAALDRAPMFGR